MKDALLTLVQMTSITGEPSSNLEKMRSFVEANRGSDIICFPEMCLSGYSTDCPEAIAMSLEDPLVSEVHRLSESTGMTIVFGYIEKGDDGLYLRQEIVHGKDVNCYRKSHLGIKERELFLPGNELPVFDVDGIRMGLQLCTESHVPDITSAYRSKGVELVIMPFANGISSDRRKEVWMTYLPARACDNGIYVGGCSAVGDNGRGTVFGGGLIALDPKGRIMSEYYGNDEHAITVRIGGKLPRDGPENMMNISYFDRRRPELY